MTSQRSWWRRWNCRKAFKVNLYPVQSLKQNKWFIFFKCLSKVRLLSQLTVFCGVSSNCLVGPSGVGPGCTDKTLLSAIASALHTSAAPITGQLSAAVEKNPGVWLNTAQPLCKAFIVTDEDIRLAFAEHTHGSLLSCFLFAWADIQLSGCKR